MKTIGFCRFSDLRTRQPYFRARKIPRLNSYLDIIRYVYVYIYVYICIHILPGGLPRPLKTQILMILGAFWMYRAH